MRGIFNPRNSAAHKLACLALYRALLRQSTRFTEEITSTTLLSLVRHRFQHDRKIESPNVICDALRKGRKAYSLLREAVEGSPTALAQLTNTLDQAAKHATELTQLRAHQNSLRSPTRPSRFSKIAHIEDHRSKYWAERIPHPIPVLDRPVPREQLPHPEKPRRVPILASAQGIPFLRYKGGAQSPKLSHVINSMYERDFKRWETVGRLYDEVGHARLEDDWDKLLYTHCGYQEAPDVLHENGTGGIQSWTEDISAAVNELQENLKTTSSKRVEVTQKMMDIVQKEKKLAEQEKAQRRTDRLETLEQEPGQ